MIVSMTQNKKKNYLIMYKTIFKRSGLELLEFNPTKHRKPSDPDFIEINPKRSMFNMIRPTPHLPSPTLTQKRINK